MTKRRLLVATLLVVLLMTATWLAVGRGTRLPPELAGAIVFVSDKDGVPALYWHRLPRDRERRLTVSSEPVGEPKVSPDNTRVAFSMNGRIGVVAVATGELQVLTLGVDWKDAEPAWLPDGKRLIVAARRRAGDPAGLHLIALASEVAPARSPLTQPLAGDDSSPAPSPDGSFVVFVREEHLMRVDFADGRVRRLTGSFKRERSPRFLGPGRIVCAWSEGKRHGLDVIDSEGKLRETLVEGGPFYRTVAPSPDGRFLAVTQSWDASFSPLAALLGTEREQVVLLDAGGRELARLTASRRHASHSPDWGR